jgi:hypothetical protein
MSRLLCDYVLLPHQLQILYTDYNVLVHELVDYYIYTCDVYRYGITHKTEFICVKIKAHQDIYCINVELAKFLDNCILPRIQSLVYHQHNQQNKQKIT